MSSTQFQQYLTPANMAMIERALGEVRLLYDLERHSPEEEQVASIMVGEFQRGTVREDDLVAVFMGMPDISAHALKKAQMRKSLDRWENEGGARQPILPAQVQPIALPMSPSR
ncbi:hypothetical protein [Mesorhizobium sp. Root157]|uniref:hypothetical protein n=1 Tax=Mesorhizobium sp. Root157 TaxID=1736477 RepID=UPI0012E3DFE3|nr:hypothetical protein [Mesorhizobium sp. Root157]